MRWRHDLVRTSFLIALGTLAATCALLASGASAAGSSARKLVLYSVAEQEQYVNNADDRTRAEGNNPFGNYKDVTPVANKSGNGPFPGDEALFSFNLFKDAKLKQRAGAAIFTCQYNFDKNAFCDVSFHLNDGSTLIGSGSFNFNATQFTLTITGTYGKLGNKKGLVQETPSLNHSQKLSFQLA